VSDIAVIGAGIIGLATGAELTRRGHSVHVLDKETALAAHQTGRNSGVIHSGLYYVPGSLKARLGEAGAHSMKRYAADHGIAHEITGKLVVATDESELPGLMKLADRAVQNNVPARLLDPAEAREYEPYVRCVKALRVETTGIVDYKGVCASLAEEIRAGGGEVRLGVEFREARTEAGRVRVTSAGGADQYDGLVVCAGLYADRAAIACGVDPGARIVPFRGEYFELDRSKTYLVNGLIYPVPDPRFPFLGVHLTKMVGGGVHAGPNAVLALRREGYTWRDVDARELAESLRWPGLWLLARRNLVPGSKEVLRSFSRASFARSLSRLVPGIEATDIHTAPAGVRAQALNRDGSLVDDFLIRRAPRQVHVINAPSPAATASLEIAKHVADELEASAAS
jgi:L-2-hydroxyglutarate oxidase